MGLQIKSTGYFDHLGRSIGFPIANQGDKGTHRITYQCFFGVHATQGMPIQIIGGADTIIQLAQGNWSDHGIVAGDSVTFNFANYENTVTFSGTVNALSVDGNSLRIEYGWSQSMISMNGYLYTNKTPQALESDFNLIPSTQASGMESIIDTSVTRFRADSIASLAVNGTVNLVQIGNKSGSIVEDIELKRLANEVDPLSGGNVLVYQVDVKFTWWGYLTELFQDYFFNAKTITPIISTRVFPQFNNYGVRMENTYKLPNDGNSGFRNENFNQGISEFQLTSFTWKDVSDNVIGAFDYSQPCKFEATINTNSTFGTNFGLIFFNDIQDLTSISAGINNDNGQYSHEQLTLFGQVANLTTSSTGTFTTATGVNGEQLTFSGITVAVSGTTATIKGTLTPNSEFTAKFEDENNFEKRFGLLFRSETASFPQPNYSTTVNTTLWVGNGEVAPVVLGAYPLTREYLLDHNGNSFIGLPAIVEDDNIYTADFIWAKNRKIKSITFKNVVKNYSDQTWFTLESYRIPFDEQILWNGTQEMPEFVNAYFYNNMPVFMSNAQKNSFVFTKDLESNQDDYRIKFQFPMLQRWEYWLPQNDVSQLFLQTANKDWVNYSDVGGWALATCVEIEVEEGSYRNFFEYKLEDYDLNFDLGLDWHFERLDSTVISSPIAGEVCKVVATWSAPVAINALWGQITVEPFESSPRWMLSSVYPSPNQPLNPLFNDNNIGMVSIVNNNTTEVRFECYIDPNKINTSQGVKFTARIHTDKEGFYDREFQVFKFVQLPNIPTTSGKGSQCCDCEPELVLAHETEEDGYKNDFTSVFHKLDVEGDECDFKIYKDGIELPNYGVVINFPNDNLLRGFCYNWRSYLNTYGGGCYTIKKVLSIVGLTFEIEEGHYQLMPYNEHTSEGTARVMGQYNKEVMYEEYGVVKVANFSDSGFETCYRFKGYFGSWQPNAEVINHYAWNGMLRNAKIRYKGSYALTMSATTNCRIKKFTKELLLFSSLLKCSDYNYTNPNQLQEVVWCVLNDEESVDIQYYEASRKASVVVSLNNMFNNEVSRYDGSINPVLGVSYQLATIGTSGEGGVCTPATAIVKNTLQNIVASATIASGNTTTLLAPNANITVKTVSNIVIATASVASGASQDIVIADPTQVEIILNQEPFITAVAPSQEIFVKNTDGNYVQVSTSTNNIILQDEDVDIYVNDVFHSSYSAPIDGNTVINITV